MAQGVSKATEVAKAVVTIIPSLAGAQKTISKELTGASEPAANSAGKSSGEKFTSSLGSALKNVGKIAATAFAGVSAAVVGVAKEAVSSFAEYEQLVGGIDTLFKDSSSTMQQYAQQAYMTAGVSANQYMETVTSFSAGLIKSLKGNTEKAAQVADMAMQDMSDNANKMGTDMSSIQTAYQGFAKQNYTMLDNLKLGYGGTKSEMERLLKDAQKISHVKYDINNLSDVYSAIHVIQTEMGITGTTAKEAMSTISGSANATKAAWQNVLTTIAGGGAGLEQSVNALMTTVFGGSEGGGLLNNLIPVVERAINGIGAFITTAAPMILPKITSLISSLLPGLIAATTSVLDAIIQQFPVLISSISQLIPQIIQSLSTLIPQLATSGLEMVRSILQGILDNLPLLMSSAANIISTLVTDLSTHLPELLSIAAQIIMQLGAGIIQNAPQLISSAITAVSNFVSGIFSELPNVLSVGGEIVGNLLTGINASLPGVIEAFSTAMSNIISAVSDAFPSLSAGISQIVTACEPIVSVIAANFTQTAGIIAQAVVDIVASLAPYTPAITQMVETVSSNLPLIIDSFTGLATSIGNTIVQIVEAIAPYIPAITEMLTKTVENLPAIVDSFSGLLSQVSPVINSIADLIKTIGQAIVDIVNSVGSNLSLIVDAFSGFNESLAVPIKAVGDAISGMITAISDGIVAVNNSISGVLDKLAGVFDSIGQAALNAGTGFKTIADACVDLANNTSVIDLAATLGAVATGIKNINHEAKWAYDNKIGESIGQVGAGLKTLVDYSVGLDGVSTAMDTFAESVKKINNETKGGTASQNIANFGTAIGTMVTNAGTEFTTLGTSIDTCLEKIKTLATEGTAALKSFGSEIKASLTSDKALFNTNFYGMESRTNSAMNSIERTVSNGMTSSNNIMSGKFNTMSGSARTGMSMSLQAVHEGLSNMQGAFNSTSFNFTSHIRLPHFGMSGNFDAETGEVPSVWVRWYDKGGIFSSPTIIGVGEKRPEFVGALDDLREIVREESNTANITVNVYGQEGQNVRELADIVIERIRTNVDRKGAAFA